MRSSVFSGVSDGGDTQYRVPPAPVAQYRHRRRFLCNVFSVLLINSVLIKGNKYPHKSDIALADELFILGKIKNKKVNREMLIIINKLI